MRYIYDTIPARCHSLFIKDDRRLKYLTDRIEAFFLTHGRGFVDRRKCTKSKLMRRVIDHEVPFASKILCNTNDKRRLYQRSFEKKKERATKVRRMLDFHILHLSSQLTQYDRLQWFIKGSTFSKN